MAERWRVVGRFAGRGFGWLLIWLVPAWRAVEAMSAASWLVNYVPTGLLEAFSTWGWIPLIAAGFAWLHWLERATEMGRSGQTDLERAFDRLPVEGVYVVRKFERFCRAFEEGNEARITFARMDLDGAVTSLIRAFVKTTPAELQFRYEMAARRMLLEGITAIEREDLSKLGSQVAPTQAVQDYLGMNKPRPTPPATPPPTTDD